MDDKETYILPLRIVSESNVTEHWTKRHARRKKQKIAIKFSLSKSHIKPPCEVTLTRIAPRMLDSEDNLPSSLKASKDAVADFLVPGLQAGRADSDDRIKWFFRQEKGNVKEYALKIEITQQDKI